MPPLDFSQEIDDWVYTDDYSSKNLFRFDGIKPTPIKQFLDSQFCYRVPEHPRRKLSRQELVNALAYFDSKPADWFTFGTSMHDVPLMLSIAETVGCVKYIGNEYGGVVDKEALYI